MTNIRKMKGCSGLYFSPLNEMWFRLVLGVVFDFVSNSQFWFSKHFKIKELLVLGV
jgi:hypothetical protein